MADTRVNYYVDGVGDLPNVESASEEARKLAAKRDAPVDVWRVEHVKVLCFKREVSVTETDLTATPPA